MSLPNLRRPEKAGTEMLTTVMSAQTTGKSTEMALQTTTETIKSTTNSKDVSF